MTYQLSVGSLDGLLFEGEVTRVRCRTISGDVAILARHCNYCSALGVGPAYFDLADGTRKFARCSGGMISVIDGKCSLLATKWVWKKNLEDAEDDIDDDDNFIDE